MKRFFKFLFSVLLLIIGIVVVFFWWGVVDEQVKHAQGVYYIYKGDKAYFKNNMKKTIFYYKKGLELYPEHFEAWFNLGNIYAVHEDYFAAIEAYQQAIKNNPKFILARMNLGNVYSEDLGDFDAAIEEVDYVEILRRDTAAKRAFCGKHGIGSSSVRYCIKRPGMGIGENGRLSL